MIFLTYSFSANFNGIVVFGRLEYVTSRFDFEFGKDRLHHYAVFFVPSCRLLKLTLHFFLLRVTIGHLTAPKRVGKLLNPSQILY